MVREVLIVRPSACARRARRSGGARQVAQRIGAYLVATHRLPDEIVADTDRRSHQLAECVAKVLGLSAGAVTHGTQLEKARGEALVAALHVMHGERLLAVSEMPGLDLPRAPLLTLDPLDATHPRVCDVVGHKQLPATFPFPTLHGIEERQYPAYYYFQSGVVPFREGDDGPEILLVTNNRGTKWGIPKGIHEPGYSAQASAAKEALEEAGVLGEVLDEVLGTYTVKKWGGTCTVTVFPMRVTRELGEEAWAESHRRRRWLPAAAAARKVKKKALARIIARCAETLSTG
ncbi:MAG: NUDIX hydrolase [Planctomycetota bacterium]|nr:NUDIX hydrolase [Planctomycetota bacterium]